MDCRKHKQQTVFQDASGRFLPDAGKKAESLLAVRQAVAQKHIQKRPAFLEQIFCQMRFHTWQHWATQGAILLCVFLLVLWTGRKGADHTVSLSVCSVFIVFAGNICLSSIVQLFSWHMAELEMTLYFDLKQVVCIRMLEAGLFDLFLLGFLSGCLESRLETGIFVCLLYLLVPFLWSEIFCLHMLAHARSMASSFRQLSCVLVSALCALFPVFWRDAYLPAYRLVWVRLSVAGCVLLILEICWIFYHMKTGDRLCRILL